MVPIPVQAQFDAKAIEIDGLELSLLRASLATQRVAGLLPALAETAQLQKSRYQGGHALSRQSLDPWTPDVRDAGSE